MQTYTLFCLSFFLQATLHGGLLEAARLTHHFTPTPFFLHKGKTKRRFSTVAALESYLAGFRPQGVMYWEVFLTPPDRVGRKYFQYTLEGPIIAGPWTIIAGPWTDKVSPASS